MYKISGITCLVVFMMIGCRAMLGGESLRLYDLSRDRELIGRQALERLATARVVIVGEHHADAGHHQAQLEVIQALNQTGAKVAIGLEMFRKQSQADLDRWVEGQLDESQFEPIYLDNWNFDWALYRPIFLYARAHKIPMVGLNTDKGLTRQVARNGFDSLTQAQKGALGRLSCDVTPEYRSYIREAFGAHAHGGMNFDYFCQAQLLWDATMAVNISAYLKQDPDTVMVVLAGSGHARKQGIPAQLADRAPWPVLVILPETAGIYEKNKVTAADADLLLR